MASKRQRDITIGRTDRGDRAAIGDMGNSPVAPIVWQRTAAGVMILGDGFAEYDIYHVPISPVMVYAIIRMIGKNMTIY